MAATTVTRTGRNPRRVGVRACLLASIALFVAAPTAHADFFGSGENRFEIPFVTVGDPGNAPDTTGAPIPAGSVGYRYRIGKYEVPEEAIRKANAQSMLDGQPLGLTLDERGPQKPATGLSWFEAARFVNWLNEDAGFAAAYKFDAAGDFQLWTPGDPGYQPRNAFRNRHARYVLPSIDEWYKAAFYDPAKDGGLGGYWDYPTGSDTPPLPVAAGTDPGTVVWNQVSGPADVILAGGESPWGTVGQSGNVAEWHESPASGITTVAPSDPVRAFRGDSWAPDTTPDSLSVFAPPADRSASFGGGSIGLRILAIPEPASAGIACLYVAVVVCGKRHRRRRLFKRIAP